MATQKGKLENGFEFESFFPDYTVTGLPDEFAYILSAIIGTALLIICFKIFAAFVGGQTHQG